MQFSASGLEINIRKRQKAVSLRLREFCKYAAIVCEPLKVGVTLLIKISAHLLDLKIGHIAQVAADCAFVRLWAVELKTLNEASFGQQLPRRIYHFRQAHIADKYTDNMCSACNPDIYIIFFRLEFSF
jgi:hypothetical protein